MIESLLPWIADGLVIMGLIVITIAVYGIIWMPGVYNRVHAAAKAVVLGIIPILVASVVTLEPAIIYRVILTVVFLILTAPVAAHAITYASYLTREPLVTPGAFDESDYLPRKEVENGED